MVLDQHEARAWADHGAEWRRGTSRLATGAKTMINRNLEHLRQLALGMGALVVATAFVGVAVLPGYLV